MKLALRNEWLPLGLVAAIFVMAAAAWPTNGRRRSREAADRQEQAEALTLA